MAPQTRIAIKIILLTGVRTAELRLAKWSEINFDESLWTIPALHSKASMVHKVHLSDLTEQLFLQLKSLSRSDYVLTGIDYCHPLTENALPELLNVFKNVWAFRSGLHMIYVVLSPINLERLYKLIL